MQNEMTERPPFAEADGVFFLTLNRDRETVAYTIERLIDMLDAMEGDPDLEAAGDELDQSYPEGWRSTPQPFEDAEDGADDEPWLGAPEARFAGGDYYYHQQTICPSVAPLGSQASWASGASDDREDDGDDLEPDHDGERSLGWVNEGSQVGLGEGHDDNEPELGWPEQIDQVRRLEIKEDWFANDGEPDLGFCGHGTGWREGEETDDREGDDEREKDGDEGDYSGHSEEFFGEWPGDGSGHAIAKQLLKRKRRTDSDDAAREIIDQRDAVRTAKLANRIALRRFGWNSEGIGNLPPEAFENLIPEIALYRPSKH